MYPWRERDLLAPIVVDFEGKAGFVREPDVLDTWFSSALWPHSTLGWPDRRRNWNTTIPPAC